MKTSTSTNVSFRAFLVLGDNLRSSCREIFAGIRSSCFIISKRTCLVAIAALSLTIALEKRGSGYLSVALAGLVGGGGAVSPTGSNGPAATSAGVGTTSDGSVTT